MCINVYRVVGWLISFVYFFGWVACWCCQLAPRWHHFCPASLPPEWHHFLFTSGIISTFISINIEDYFFKTEILWKYNSNFIHRLSLSHETSLKPETNVFKASQLQRVSVLSVLTRLWKPNELQVFVKKNWQNSVRNRMENKTSLNDTSAHDGGKKLPIFLLSLEQG